jgi:hypothetical protein
MRTLLWLCTIIGLLPSVLLVVVNLSLMTWVHWTNRDPDAIVFIGDTQVGIASLKPMHLSSSPWPSVLILMGACVLFVGLWFLTQPPAPVIWETDEPAASVHQEPPGKAEV